MTWAFLHSWKHSKKAPPSLIGRPVRYSTHWALFPETTVIAQHLVSKTFSFKLLVSKTFPGGKGLLVHSLSTMIIMKIQLNTKCYHPMACGLTQCFLFHHLNISVLHTKRKCFVRGQLWVYQPPP